MLVILTHTDTILLTIFSPKLQVMRFLKFNDSKLVLNNSFIFTKTLFMLILKSLGLGLFAIMLVSSAYETILAFLVNLGRQLVQKRKSYGTRIEPGGTPC